MIVNYDEVLRQMEIRSGINRMPLEEIEWVRDDGTRIVFDPKLVDEFKFIGLNNTSFVELFLSRVVEGEEKELLEELEWKEVK
jgi:hypothetical protein